CDERPSASSEVALIARAGVSHRGSVRRGASFIDGDGLLDDANASAKSGGRNKSSRCEFWHFYKADTRTSSAGGKTVLSRQHRTSGTVKIYDGEYQLDLETAAETSQSKPGTARRWVL